MDKIEEEQRIQESLYDFPYHHIPSFDHGNFSAIRSHRGAHEYLGLIFFVISKIKEIPFASLLDVGCGDGRLLYDLSKKIPSKRYVGVDYSAKAVSFAKVMAPNVEFTVSDITKKEIGKFDIVTLIETLEHIQLDQIKDFVAALHKHTKNFLIVTVPSKNTPKTPKHYQHFDLKTLENTLKPYFTIKEYRFITKKTKLARIIKSLLANRFFALNHKYTLNKIFQMYMKNSFYGNNKNSGRIFVLCTPNVITAGSNA